MLFWTFNLLSAVALLVLLLRRGRVGLISSGTRPKDPQDFKLDENSTSWETDTYCPTCYCRNTHSDFMANVCSGCGSNFANCLVFKNRSRRKIWDGSRWIYQYKYPNNVTKFDETYPPSVSIDYRGPQ